MPSPPLGQLHRNLEAAAAGAVRRAARFFWPSECLACFARPVDAFFAGGVCETCWAALSAADPERCARCEEAMPGAFVPALCGRCVPDPPPFRSLRAAAPYRGAARRILLAFKFQGADFLAPHLARLMAERLGPADADEVAAVPATPRARRRRGYHPAERLAAALAKALALPYARARLVKTRETEVQSRVPAERRAANVRRAFRVEGRPAERVLLIDDVATSGATARECARALIRSGARVVDVWCFARASRTDLADADSVAP